VIHRLLFRVPAARLRHYIAVAHVTYDGTHPPGCTRLVTPEFLTDMNNYVLSTPELFKIDFVTERSGFERIRVIHRD